MALPNYFYNFNVDNTSGGFNAINGTAAALQALLAAGGRWTMYVSTETGGIRWRTDGTDPTTSVGHLVAAAGSVTISGHDNIRRFKMIRDGSTTANVSVTLHGELV